jgi:hypothetical protein
VMDFFKIGSHKLFAGGLTSNHDPLDLCLLSSKDHRREPLVPCLLLLLMLVLSLLLFNNGPFVKQQVIWGQRSKFPNLSVNGPFNPGV